MSLILFCPGRYDPQNVSLFGREGVVCPSVGSVRVVCRVVDNGHADVAKRYYGEGRPLSRDMQSKDHDTNPRATF